MFFSYILECSDGSYYVGVTDDPLRRSQEHNDGKGSVCLERNFPVTLVST